MQAEEFGRLPGFSTRDGWPTQSEAEAASDGGTIERTLEESQTVRFWYHDEVCEDNLGSVTYCVTEVTGP